MLTEKEKRRIIVRLSKPECFGNAIFCSTPDCKISRECYEEYDKHNGFLGKAFEENKDKIKSIIECRISTTGEINNGKTNKKKNTKK